jgi:hypothetical protein
MARPNERGPVSIYSKTVYIEVEAEDEDEAEQLISGIADRISGAYNIDLEGPIEDVTEQVNPGEVVQ